MQILHIVKPINQRIGNNTPKTGTGQGYIECNKTNKQIKKIYFPGKK